MRGKALSGAAAVTALVLALLPGPAVSAPPCGEDGQVLYRGNGWTTIKPPAFPPYVAPVSGSATPQFYELAVDPHNPDVLYASDRDIVSKSDDGGCTWNTVFETVSIGALNQDPHAILDVVIPRAKKAQGTVYIVTSTSNTFYLQKSTDAGATWTTMNDGRPIGRGAFKDLDIAPSDPSILYVTVFQAAGLPKTGGSLPAAGGQSASVPAIFASADGGKTWEQRTDDQAELVVQTEPRTISYEATIDPLDPQTIWTFDVERVRVSHDGGASFKVVDSVRTNYGGGARDVAVMHQPGEPARILVLPVVEANSPHPGYIFRSDDGGETFKPVLTYGDPYDAYWGANPNQIVIAGTSGAYRYDKRLARRANAIPWVMLPPPYFLDDITLTDGGKPILYGRAGGPQTIERYSGRI